MVSHWRRRRRDFLRLGRLTKPTKILALSPGRRPPDVSETDSSNVSGIRSDVSETDGSNVYGSRATYP